MGHHEPGDAVVVAGHLLGVSDGEDDGGQPQHAQAAVPDQAPDPREFWDVGVVVSGDAYSALVVGQAYQLGDFTGVPADRLFDEDMLSGQKRGASLIDVVPGRRQDEDSVNVVG